MQDVKTLPMSDKEQQHYDDNKDDKTKFTNRMIVCGIAIVMLWCTSLSLSGAFPRRGSSDQTLPLATKVPADT